MRYPLNVGWKSNLPLGQVAAPPAARPALIYPPFGKAVQNKSGNIAVRITLAAGAPARKAAAVRQQLAKGGFLDFCHG